jgi:hypothetical protein
MFTIHHPVAATIVLLSGALLLAHGAADDKTPEIAGSIKGVVTCAGKPLPGGTVAFHPAKGKPVVGVLQADGSYAIKNIPAGEYRVTLETESAKPQPKEKLPPKDKDTSKVEAPKDTGRYLPIPRVYADPKTSPLVFTVQNGQNNADLHLAK